MNPITRFPLRKIAESELARHFGPLELDVRSALATSLVRQWLTHDGHAGFVTPTHEFWFEMVVKGASAEVGVTAVQMNWGKTLAEDWNVPDEEIPDLLHRLNLCQTAVAFSSDGRTLRMRLEPKGRLIECREQQEEED